MNAENANLNVNVNVNVNVNANANVKATVIANTIAIFRDGTEYFTRYLIIMSVM
jgi:hypothetical protein